MAKKKASKKATPVDLSEKAFLDSILEDKKREVAEHYRDSCSKYAKIRTIEVWGWLDEWSEKLEVMRRANRIDKKELMIVQLVLDNLCSFLQTEDRDHEARMHDIIREVGEFNLDDY